MRRLIVIVIMLFVCPALSAQQFEGMSGLLHVPDGVVDVEGASRIGVHYVGQEMMPDNDYFSWEDESGTLHRYGSFLYSLSITPFSWVEASYTCALLKSGPKLSDFNSKDRHFAIKFNPLKEGKYWPSVSVGASDFVGSSLDIFNSQDFFGNVYLSATKHFTFSEHELGVHISYRYYFRDFNKRFQGVVGGVTYRPAFAPNFRLVVEYDGCHLNAGIDAIFWKHLVLQASLHGGNTFCGGIMYKFYLLK